MPCCVSLCSLIAPLMISPTNTIPAFRNYVHLGKDKTGIHSLPQQPPLCWLPPPPRRSASSCNCKIDKRVTNQFTSTMLCVSLFIDRLLEDFADKHTRPACRNSIHLGKDKPSSHTYLSNFLQAGTTSTETATASSCDCEIGNRWTKQITNAVLCLSVRRSHPW